MSRMPTLAELTPSRQNLPRHVAIIMDGNGRWAKKRGLPRVFGHHRGVEAVRRIVEASATWGLEVLTLFAFSEENWGRPRTEVTAIFKILNEYIISEREELKRQNVRLRIMGDLTRLPSKTSELLNDAMRYLDSSTGLTLNVGISYGARSEIVKAARLIALAAKQGRLDPDDIDEEMIASRLDTAGLPDPDLLIRTSGEQRLSNFLLWQASYAEFLFTPVLWPDFDLKVFAECIAEYQRRSRRFGKLTDDSGSVQPLAGVPTNGGVSLTGNVGLKPDIHA